MDNFDLFLKHLDASQVWTWKAARLFQERGYHVQIPPVTKAKHVDEWEDHIDDGDLYISKENLLNLRGVKPWYAPVAHRVEVKHRGVNFTCADDFPYGKDGMFVCAKPAWDRATPKPWIFICWNHKGTHYAVIKGSTSDQWGSIVRRDGRYVGYEQEFLCCPLDLVSFREI